MLAFLQLVVDNIHTIIWSAITMMLASGIGIYATNKLEEEIGARKGAEKKLQVHIKQLNQAKKKISLQEQRLHAILSSMGEGLIVCDDKCRVKMINQAGSALLRHPPDEAVGKYLNDLSNFYFEDPERTDFLPHTLIGKVIKDSDVITVTSIDRLLCKNGHGRIFPLVMVVAPLMYLAEDPSAILLIRDGTKEADVDKAKTEFVSIASHQLRTPLATIGWYAQMLLAGDAGKVTKAQRDLLLEIDSSNRRMADLVNVLLDTSRIEMGTFMIRPEIIQWDKTITEVLSDIQSQMQEKKINLIETIAKDLPAIPADPRLLRIVIQNLISNAIKYTPEKGKIEVSLQSDKDGVLFRVKDNGYGIPKNEQNKIFSKMYRASNVVKRAVEGNGLGLYIVKSIIEQGGGKIWFNSKENKGTEFNISLPFSGMRAKEGTKMLD